MYQLRYTPQFDSDIDKIREDVFSVSYSDVIADNYIRDFILKIKKKQEFPQSGIPLYYCDFFTGFYFVHFKAYNAFYVIKGEYIELVRALPSKSDYMRILFGEYYMDDIEDRANDLYLNESNEMQ